MGEGGHRGRAGAIEHEGGEIVEIVEFELFEHRQKSSTACFVTCREAVDVADDLIGFADVPAHHGDEVVVEFASLDPLQDRDAHALLVHLAGLGAVAATPTSTTCAVDAKKPTSDVSSLGSRKTGVVTVMS